MAEAVSWAPPETDFAATAIPEGWAPPESDFQGQTKQTWGGAAQAVGSGLVSGAIGAETFIAGAATRAMLGPMGPQLLSPDTVAQGTEWLKNQFRGLGHSNLLDPTEKTTLNKYIHAGSEQVPGALVGGSVASVPRLAKAVGAGFGAGEAQQGISDLGLPKEVADPLSQIAGFLAGLATGGKSQRKSETTPRAPAEPGNYRFPTAELDIAKPPEGPKGSPTDITAELPPLSPTGGSAAKPPSTSPPPPVTFNSPREEGMKSGPIPPTGQAERATAYKNIGLREVRNSAITGDTGATGQEHRWAQFRNPDGTASPAAERMSGVIKNEQQALSNYAGEIVTQSGGTAGLDQFNLKGRGSSIVEPLDAYRESLESIGKQHYEIAKERKGTTPITLPETAGYLKDNEADFLGTVDGKQLLEGLKAKMNQLKLTDAGPATPTGVALAALRGDTPATVNQAEGLRQYANNQWSPRTAHLVSAFKDALDSDVTKAAGEDVFAESRAIRVLRSKILEEPAAVQKIISPPKINNRLGVNRETDLEDVPRYVTHLGSDQFNHLIDVYDTAYRTPEIAPQAQRAVNEIRAQFANEAKAAGETSQGVWNPKGYYKYLVDNNVNMSRVFSPAEMQRFKTLNIAGNGLKMDTSYKGAAVEQHNLIRRGTLGLVKHGGTLIGGLAGEAATGGMAGTLIGGGAGKLAEKGAAAIEASGHRKLVEKAIRQL